MTYSGGELSKLIGLPNNSVRLYSWIKKYKRPVEIIDKHGSKRMVLTEEDKEWVLNLPEYSKWKKEDIQEKETSSVVTEKLDKVLEQLIAFEKKMDKLMNKIPAIPEIMITQEKSDSIQSLIFDADIMVCLNRSKILGKFLDEKEKTDLKELTEKEADDLIIKLQQS